MALNYRMNISARPTGPKLPAHLPGPGLGPRPIAVPASRPPPPRAESGGGGGKVEEGGEAGRALTLDDVNPVGLGRRSRQIFDEVWRKFSELGQISRSRSDEVLDQVLIRGPMCEFTVPGAQDTTVLVVGATSRIGRLVVRKLMIRGYKVKVIQFATFVFSFDSGINGGHLRGEIRILLLLLGGP